MCVCVWWSWWSGGAREAAQLLLSGPASRGGGQRWQRAGHTLRAAGTGLCLGPECRRAGRRPCCRRGRPHPPGTTLACSLRHAGWVHRGARRVLVDQQAAAGMAGRRGNVGSSSGGLARHARRSPHPCLLAHPNRARQRSRVGPRGAACRSQWRSALPPPLQAARQGGARPTSELARQSGMLPDPICSVARAWRTPLGPHLCLGPPANVRHT